MCIYNIIDIVFRLIKNLKYNYNSILNTRLKTTRYNVNSELSYLVNNLRLINHLRDNIYITRECIILIIVIYFIY